MSAPVLETERLILRPHRAEDFDDVAAMWADPAVVQFISGVPSTGEASWSRLLRYIGHWHALDYGFWAVTDKETGVFLGEVGFADFKREIKPSLGGHPECGWVMASAAHGRGIATEAVARIHQWADEVKGWKETVSIFDPDHKASHNVARKNGYEVSGEAVLGDLPTLVMRRTKD
ncbi:GNAT family N-acetyltransferase [Parasedimentitalea maritima]|uniref:GNAT family N-acetyltransferase n=1 Tax=Parasedimentitalea maritima TaxID=2578117 RepID=A0A6A4RL41_9RHOB|nr:GNAT family N-acetyltransferase [Zongyanglinia marina]KAE9632529.1 GNAT family N-acetyltransferase [Zongyanglinia marina]